MSAFSAFLLCGISSTPYFPGVRGTLLPHFPHFRRVGFESLISKIRPTPALLWPALGDRESSHIGHGSQRVFRRLCGGLFEGAAGSPRGCLPVSAEFSDGSDPILVEGDLKEQQYVRHPQDCTSDVHHKFCWGGELIVGFDFYLHGGCSWTIKSRYGFGGLSQENCATTSQSHCNPYVCSGQMEAKRSNSKLFTFFAVFTEIQVCQRRDLEKFQGQTQKKTVWKKIKNPIQKLSRFKKIENIGSQHWLQIKFGVTCTPNFEVRKKFES